MDPGSGADAGTRGETSHILVGVLPDGAFTVLCGEGPAAVLSTAADSLGILSFSVDDAALPDGPVTITVTGAAAPVITGIRIEDITPTSAVVAWTTDTPATSQVEYGPAPSCDADTPLDESLTTTHSAALAGLLPGTTYLVRALSNGPEGLPAAAETSFETLPLDAAGAPIIGGFGARAVSPTFVVITWATDRPATSQVRFGMKGRLDRLTDADPTLVMHHSVLIGPLVPCIPYSFAAVSASGGEAATCDPCVIATPAVPMLIEEEKGPEIVRSGTPAVEDTSVIFRWVTDRPCTTWVECGEDERLGRWCPAIRVNERGYEAAAGGLAPSTTYVYRIYAVDATGAFTASAADTFRTAAVPRDEAPGLPEACTGVDGGEDEGVSASLSLSLHPNPAVDEARLTLFLPEAGRARVSIYSAAGRLVRVLGDGVYPAGPRTLSWDLTSESGAGVASGAYLCAVESGGAVATSKLIALR